MSDYPMLLLYGNSMWVLKNCFLIEPQRRRGHREKKEVCSQMIWKYYIRLFCTLQVSNLCQINTFLWSKDCVLPDIDTFANVHRLRLVLVVIIAWRFLGDS